MSGNIEDRMAIANLANAYSAAANRLDGHGMTRVLTPDAILGGVLKMTVGSDADVVGAEAIGEFFTQAFKGLDFVHQIPNVLEIEFQGNTARVNTLIVEYLKAKGGPVTLMLANYEDTAVRTAESWRFSRRVFRVKSATPVNAAS